MSVRKRNDFLDAGDSDEDDILSSDHEAAADSRTTRLTSRSSKRRKISPSHSEIDDESDEAASNDDPATSPSKSPPHPSTDVSAPSKPASPPPSKKHKPPNPTHKPGVIYLSRIPPFMRPSTVKTLLTPHGPITKIFLTPEPPTTYLRRKKSGGNKKHSFIDGWVEFARKKHAKQCVDAINGQIVGGKKGGWYRDDVWNVKYLRGFGWGDLMEGVRAEEREREERVRVGVKREGREREMFVRNLERGKVEETRRVKREAKLKKEGKEVGGSKGGDSQAVEKGDESVVDVGGNGRRKGFERRFRQNEVKGKDSMQREQPDEVKRVLSKIF